MIKQLRVAGAIKVQYVMCTIHIHVLLLQLISMASQILPLQM